MVDCSEKKVAVAWGKERRKFLQRKKNLEKECWIMMARGGLEKASEDSELPIMRLDVLLCFFFRCRSSDHHSTDTKKRNRLI